MPMANNKARLLAWEPEKFSQFGYFQVISLVCGQLWVYSGVVLLWLVLGGLTYLSRTS